MYFNLEQGLQTTVSGPNLARHPFLQIKLCQNIAPLICIVSLAVFTLQQQLIPKPKIFATWPFTEKVYGPFI